MSTHLLRTLFLMSAAVALGACSGAGDAPSPATATPVDSAAASPAAPALVADVTLAEYAAESAPAGGNCALDVVNGAGEAVTVAAAGSALSIAGWFANAENNVPSDASLVLTGASQSYSGALPAGADRPDVSKALGAESARMSGYNANVSLSGVAAGDYALSVVYPGASPLSCALNKSVRVTAGG